MKCKNAFFFLLFFIVSNVCAKPEFLREKYLELEIIETPQDVIEYDSNAAIKGYLCLKNNIGHNNSCHKIAAEDLTKYDLKFTYPYPAVDITPNVQLIEEDNRYRFEVTLPALATNVQAPSFGAYISEKNSGKFGLQVAYQKILAHIERLEQLKDKLDPKGNKSYQKQLGHLQAISKKLEKKIYSLDARWSERTLPLQLKNFIAGPSSWMVSTGSWSIEASTQLGVGFKGENSWLNLNFDPFNDVDDEWKIEVEQNGQVIYTKEGFTSNLEKKILLLGNHVGESNVHVKVWGKNQKKNNFKWEPIFKRDFSLLRFDDSIAPSYKSFFPAPGRYVGRDVPSFALTLEDPRGRMDRTTVDGELIEDSGIRYSLSNVLSFETSQSTLVASIHGGQNGSDLFNIRGVPQGVPEGFYSLQMLVKDFAGNQAPEAQWRFIVDRTPPVIALPNVPRVGTNEESFELPISVYDATNVLVQVFVNGSFAGETRFKEDGIAVDLVEGINFVRISAVDEAGNMSEVNYPPIILDTTPPVLASVNLENGELIRTQKFTLQGQSNEELIAVMINGEEIDFVTDDKRTFAHTLNLLVDGPQSVDITLVDIAGNRSEYSIEFDFLLKLLEPNLIDVALSDEEGKIKIIGFPGATIPNIQITAEENLFNSEEVTSSEDGSFEIILDPFTYAKVTAFDPDRNRSESTIVNFKNDTTLAGQVKDTFDNPLPGVTVRIVSSGQTAITDAAGTFAIPNPALGDQVITIDGRSVPEEIRQGQKEYSVITMNVSLGNEQKNIIERTIYLAPKLLDGTEVSVVPGSGTVVSSPHAPGVELEIPASIATFPGGSKSGTINILQIPSSKTSIELLEEAEPDTVYAFEPSGLKFSQPVKLTLPNTNEFPVGTELVILSKNSVSGNWEFDGAASVTDGNVIETKPGMGITHFSELYVAPFGMEIKAFKDGDRPSFDTMSSGAVSTSVSLPSFKSLGQDVAPALIYNSQWANPSVVISNVFDLPRKYMEASFSESMGGWMGSGKISGSIQQWIIPDHIDAQFVTGNLESPKVRFTGMPDRSLVSYQADLSELPSGIYPSKSSYEIRFRELTIRTIKQKTKSFLGTKTKTKTWKESKLLEEIFPQELVTTIYQQNKKYSEVGAGWKLNLGKKILNPEQDRLMLEHEDGKVSAYSLKNTVETVQYDEAGLRSFTVDGDNIYGVNMKGDVLRSTNVTNTQVVQTLMPYQGKYGVNTSWYSHWTRRCVKSGYSGCSKREYSYYFNCNKYDVDFNFQRKVKSMMIKNGNLVYLDQLGALWTGNSFQPIAGFYDVPESYKVASNATSEQNYQTQCQAIGMENCGSIKNNLNDYDIRIINNSTNTIGWCNQPAYCYAGKCTTSWRQSEGRLPISGVQDGALGYAKFNRPVALSDGPLPDSYLIADYGNNLVRLVDTVSGQVSTFAGNKNKLDNGDGGLATAASIFHPRGLLLLNDGSVLISSENGYIRRVTTDGKISHYAGKPTSKGGVLSDITSMKDVALSSPSVMVMDRERNYIYVADTGHNRILRFDVNNDEARVVAGNGTCTVGDVLDGKAALDVALCRPEQIGLDSNGNLLVLDEANKRVRRVNFSTPDNGLIRFEPLAKDNTQLYRNEIGQFFLTTRDGKETIFNANGLELQTSDRAGRVMSYQWDENGKLLSATLPTGQKIQLNYSGDHLNSITDAAGRVTELNFSGNALTSIQFPDGTEKSFNYNEKDILTEEINQRGHSTKYILNQWSRISKIIRPDGSSVTIDDAISKTISNNNVNGASSELKSFGTDQDSLQDLISDAKGNTTSFLRDTNGYVQEIIDNRGEVTKIERDSEGRPTKILKPDQSFTELTYNQQTGDLLKRYESASNTSEEYTYNGSGQLTSYKDPMNSVKTNIYDLQTGLLLKEIDPNGNFVANTYGSLGLVTSTTNTLGHTTNYAYNPQGNLTNVTAPMGEVTNYVRDNAGNVISKTNAKGQTIAYSFDAFNRLSSVKTAGGYTTSYTYLPTGELSIIINPEGYQTTFEYDELGRLVKKTSPRGQIWSLFYDKNDNLVKEISPNGVQKNFEYDDSNQLIRKILPDDEYTFAYNEKGSIVSASNKASNLQFAYLSILGNELVSSVQASGLHSPAYSLNYGYNSAGKRTSMQSDFISLNYEMDTAYRLTKITNNLGQSFGFGYDQANRLVEITRYNSVNTNLSFDSNSFLTQVAHMKNSASLESFIYTRDQIGNRTSLTTSRGVSSFTYDNENQLISSTHPEADELHQLEQFNYDSLGNRIADNLGSYSYDEKKYRLEEDWKYLYSYDLNGNLISKQEKGLSGKVWNYTYSSENQLVKAEFYEGLTKIKTLEFSYDVLGRRIRKYVQDLQSNTEFERRYAYDGSEIIAELDENNNVLARYTHSGLRTDDVLSVDITTAGSARGLASVSGSYTYLKDSLGSIQAITDSAGNVLQRYVYSSFGKLLKVTDNFGNEFAPIVRTSYTYTNRELDEETGLYYYRARFYDPALGRFLTEDPEPGSGYIPLTVVNRYIYAGNQPINNLDPTGRSFLGKVAAIAVGALFGPVGILVAINLSGDFTSGEKKFANTVAIVSAAVIAGAATGGAIAAAGGAAWLGALGGAVAGGLIGGAGFETMGIGSFQDGFIVGAVAGGIGGYFGAGGSLPSMGSIQNATSDKLSWSYLTSKPALIGYGVAASKQIANLSCDKGEIYSFSGGGKCIEKPSLFWEEFL